MTSHFTFPLKDNVGETEFLKFDDMFARSASAAMISTLPSEDYGTRTDSFALVNVNKFFEYGTSNTYHTKLISFPHVNGPEKITHLLVHPDMSVCLGIENKVSPENSMIINCPLRIKYDGLSGRNLERLQDEAERWVDTAQQFPSSAWNSETEMPEGIRHPWCDMDTCHTAINRKLEKLLWALHLSASDMKLVDNINDLVLILYGRTALSDGTISKPRVAAFAPSNGAGHQDLEDLTEITNSDFAELSENLLHNFSEQDSLISQEWDRMGFDNKPYSILPSALVYLDSTSKSSLTAHEQVSAWSMIQSIAQKPGKGISDDETEPA